MKIKILMVLFALGFAMTIPAKQTQARPMCFEFEEVTYPVWMGSYYIYVTVDVGTSVQC